jgi:hypothetical protein
MSEVCLFNPVCLTYSLLWFFFQIQGIIFAALIGKAPNLDLVQRAVDCRDKVALIWSIQDRILVDVSDEDASLLEQCLPERLCFSPLGLRGMRRSRFDHVTSGFLKRGAEMGCISCATTFAMYFMREDWDFAIRIQAKVSGWTEPFFNNFVVYTRELVADHRKEKKHARLIFFAGEIMMHHPFRNTHRMNSDRRMEMTTVINMYNEWTNAARERVVLWVMWAKSIRFQKDVRRIISRLIWKGRKEGDNWKRFWRP